MSDRARTRSASGSEKAPRVVITGGGTGGHVYPALAIASAIKALRPAADLLYVGGDRMEAKVVPEAGLPFRSISVHGIAGGIPAAKRLRALIEIAAWVPLFQSLGILRRFRPDVVIGTGGYVSGPVLLAAELMRIPRLALDGNRAPGWTSRLVARFVNVMAVAHPEMAEFFAARVGKGARVEVTGLPIRADVVSATRVRGARSLGLDPALFTLVVFGGSLGSRRLNEALRGALPRLGESKGVPEGIQVLHVVGQRYSGEAEDVAEPGVDYGLLPYLGEHYGDALAAADLVVARAGASTVAELTARGLPSVLIPWSAASTGEQWLNAEPLGRAGAAVVIPDRELTADRLAATLIELLGDPDRLAQMADASRKLGRPDAAEAVARLALGLADSKRAATS